MLISSYSKNNRNRLALLIFSMASLFIFAFVYQAQAKSISLGTTTDVIYTGGSFGVGTGVVGANEKVRIEVPDGYWGLQFTRSGNPVGGIYTNTGNLYLENASGAQLNLNGTNIGMAGNVGIGTSSPSSRLEVAGGNIVVDSGAAAGTTRYLSFVSSRALVGWDGTLGLAFLRSSDTSKSVAFGAGSSEYLRITGAGNVGIGITNPTAKLYINPGATPGLIGNGSIQFPLLGAAGNVVIMADNAGTLYSTTTAAFFSSYSPTSLWNGTKDAAIWNGTAGAGNVGIGLTNPTYKLHVVGTSYLNGQVTTALSGSGNRCVYVDASGNLLAKTSDCGTATGGDNLGDHIATQNIQLGAYWLSGDGGNEGISVTAAGNVGIGTSTPGSLFSVGTASSSSAKLFDIYAPSLLSGSYVYSAIGRSANTGESGMIGYTYNSTTANSYLWLGNAGDSVATGGVGLYVRKGGNVGVGLTNPVAKLDVVGSLRNTLATTHSLLGGSGNVLVMADNTGALYSTTTSSFLNNASLWGGTKNGVIYNGDAGAGSVGIGTTNTGATLHLKGPGIGAAYNGDPILQLIQAPNGTPWALVIANDMNTNRQYDLGMWSADNGVSHITFTQGPNGSGFWFVPSAASGINANDTVETNANFAVKNPTHSSTYFLVNNVTGNVGIGLTNPAHKLSVAGTSYLNGQISTSLSGTGNRCVYVDASGNLLAKSADCGTATGGDNLGNHIATQNIQLGAYWLSGDGGNEGISVTAAGNVGVGTSAPGYALDTVGQIKSRLASTGNATGIVIGNNGSEQPQILFNASDNSARFKIQVNSLNTANERLSIYAGPLNGTATYETLVVGGNGNVGVGTTNPLNNLQVGSQTSVSTASPNTLSLGGTYSSTAGTNPKLKIWDSGSGTAYGFGVSSNSLDQMIPTGAAFNWYINGANKMSLNTNGNLGIGTSSPGYKLDVVGDINVSGALRINGTAISPGQWTVNGTSIYYNTGNVGIGITNPTAKLDVVGSLRNTLSTTHSLLGGAGNVYVAADNTGALYQGLISEVSSAINLGGGIINKRTPVANVNYTAQAADYIIAYTSLTANRTVTLPTALCASGRTFIIVNETSSAYSVIIDPEGATTIAGQTTIELDANNSTPVYCNGTNWFIY